ncbi:MAG TPA: N-acetylmuramoyl-L-alanine amidase [Thermodesulfobacteriota bacterium]|nr:N-acetylmuramoyl-L-alanine amidase [Thermodesulfobacteriota bacterium]
MSPRVLPPLPPLLPQPHIAGSSLKTLFVLLLFLIAVFIPDEVYPLAPMTHVTRIRHWSNPDYTRVVIDLSEKTTYSYRLLKQDPSINKPRRLYVDIEGGTLGKEIDRSIPIYDGLLMEARAGQFDRSTVRVVLDIESIEEYKVFALQNPFRIIIDVSGKRRASGQKADRAEEAGGAGGVKRDYEKQALRKYKKGLRIVIDPGHGGKDPGAIGRSGLEEKEVTLKISELLREKLSKKLGSAEIIMTRDTDVFIPLEERTAIANKVDADLFVSVHINASPRRAASGIETYILSRAKDEEARRLAARENATTAGALSDLEFILADLIKTAKTNDSMRLAASVQENLVDGLKTRYRGINSNGVKGAPFYVLVGTRMPSILVEVSFISNPTEERRLKDPRYLSTVVEGIASGVIAYINGSGLT